MTGSTRASLVPVCGTERPRGHSERPPAREGILGVSQASTDWGLWSPVTQAGLVSPWAQRGSRTQAHRGTHKGCVVRSTVLTPQPTLPPTPGTVLPAVVRRGQRRPPNAHPEAGLKDGA